MPPLNDGSRAQDHRLPTATPSASATVEGRLGEAAAPTARAEKTYWRSVNDLADTTEFRKLVENEFPSRLDELIDPVSRRRFVQVMGASLAMAGLTGCDVLRWPKKQILPFAQRPEGYKPGTAQYYATAMELGGVGLGLLVTASDGRPRKIEGNPSHPESLGATTPYAQASVLGLYDPDRSARVVKKGSEAAGSWDQFVTELAPRFAQHRRDKGLKLSVLCEATSSPTVEALRRELADECPRLRWYEYEPVATDNAREGARMVFGSPFRTHLRIDRADVIVALDADLFSEHAAGVRHSREFARRRKPSDRAMNRLYSVESTFSITGGMADIRQPLQAGQILHFGLRLAARVLEDKGLSATASKVLVEKLGEFQLDEDHDELVERIAQDLLASRGRSIVAVGTRQPAALHAIGHLLNGLLANAGQTVHYTAEAERPSYADALATLVEEMKTERVETLVILGANPALTAPTDAGFTDALERVPVSIHLGEYFDETARLCTWHVPRAHYLEAWADTRAYDGTISVVQPVIRPLYHGKSAVEMLARMLGRSGVDAEGYTLVRAAHTARAGELQFEGLWRRALHDGVVPGSGYELVRPQRNDAPLLKHLGSLPTQAPLATKAELELVLVPDAKVYDGRFANNAWLQELPHPLTKLTWDNALLIGRETAQEHELVDGDVVLLAPKEGEKQRLEVAVMIVPGMPPFTGTLALGYGRGEAAGIVASEASQGGGFNAYALRTRKALDVVQGVALTKTGKRYELATTQDHHAVETPTSIPEKEKRAGELIREGTLERFLGEPKFAKSVWEGGHHGVGPDPGKTQLWKPPLEYDGYKWGMAIDLNVCTGCSACVVACQAENNIPVVGKAEVARGREMHWLRVDRYFADKPLAAMPRPTARPRAPRGSRRPRPWRAKPARRRRPRPSPGRCGWSTSRSPACTARTPPASRCARSPRPCTRARGSTTWSTTAASAPATAATTAPTRCGASTTSGTTMGRSTRAASRGRRTSPSCPPTS